MSLTQTLRHLYPRAVFAHEFLGPARSTGNGFGLSRLAAKSLIHNGIAVVVQSIAGLRRRVRTRFTLLDGFTRGRGVVGTGEHFRGRAFGKDPCGAGARPLSAGGTARFREVVRYPITIVVFAIAYLNARSAVAPRIENTIRVGQSLTALHNLAFPVDTRRLLHSRRCTDRSATTAILRVILQIETGSIAIRESLPTGTCTLLALAHTRESSSTRSVVQGAIAIVIDAIALLLCCRGRSARRKTIRTAHSRSLAGSILVFDAAGRDRLFLDCERRAGTFLLDR